MANLTKSRESKAAKIVETIKGKNIIKPSTYRFLSLEERFAKLMHLYDNISDWKSEYAKVEKRKPRDIRTELTVETAEDVIDGVAYDDLLEATLSMHIANKIAHEAIFAKETIIEKFVTEKVRNKELDESLLKAENLNIVIKRIAIVHDTINDRNSLITKISKAELEKLGITSKMLQELSGKGIEDLNQLERTAFYIKSYETDNVIEMLKDRDDISYGMIHNETGNALVIDLPYYGQFIVHVKTKKSISALSDIPYDEIRVYEKESVILTDDISEAGKKFIDSRKQNGKTDLNQLIPELRKIRKDRPRFAHYVALKMGATKQELDEIYKDYKILEDPKVVNVGGKVGRRTPNNWER